MSELRILADVIELSGVPVAKLLPDLTLSLRDALAWALDAADQDYVAYLEDRVAALEEQLKVTA